MARRIFSAFLVVWATLGAAACADEPGELIQTSFDSAAAWRPASLLEASAAGPASFTSLIPADRESTLMQVAMTPETTDGTWVLVAPYVWAPAEKGKIGARGLTASVDLSLADLIDLIPDLNGAFMGHVEVGKGQYGLIFDGMLMQVEPSGRLPGGGSAKFLTGSTILETLGMLRVLDVPEQGSSGSLVTVDLLAGARYYQTQNELTLRPAIGPVLRADLTKDWMDLVFGARTEFALTSELFGFLRADIAGFGIGTSSDFTWNLTTGAEYKCASHPGTSLVLGYRVFSIDESQGSGNDRFVYDVLLHGPFSAVAFRF